MYYTISKSLPGSDVYFDEGETYTNFDAANRDARQIFESHAGYRPSFNEDGFYQDGSGLEVIVLGDID